MVLKCLRISCSAIMDGFKGKSFTHWRSIHDESGRVASGAKMRRWAPLATRRGLQCNTKEILFNRIQPSEAIVRAVKSSKESSVTNTQLSFVRAEESCRTRKIPTMDFAHTEVSAQHVECVWLVEETASTQKSYWQKFQLCVQRTM